VEGSFILDYNSVTLSRWWWRGHQEKTNDVGVIHHRRAKVSGLCVVRERERERESQI
jgi:hypothetical protein